MTAEALQERVRAMISQEYGRPVSHPVLHSLGIPDPARLRSKGGPKAEAIFVAAGGGPLGAREQVSTSVFGWQPDWISLAERGGTLFALHSFGALPGDGVDGWSFMILDDEVLAWHLGFDYTQNHLELRGTHPDGPLCAAALAAWQEHFATHE